MLGKTLIKLYQEPRIKDTEMIPETTKVAYPTLRVQEYLTYDDIISQVPNSHKIKSNTPLSMENLPINDGNGQSYGYIVYRTVADISNGTFFEVRLIGFLKMF